MLAELGSGGIGGFRMDHLRSFCLGIGICPPREQVNAKAGKSQCRQRFRQMRLFRRSDNRFSVQCKFRKLTNVEELYHLSWRGYIPYHVTAQPLCTWSDCLFAMVGTQWNVYSLHGSDCGKFSLSHYLISFNI